MEGFGLKMYSCSAQPGAYAAKYLFFVLFRKKWPACSLTDSG